MTQEEYEQLTLVQEVVSNHTSEIVSTVTEFNESEVIDRYTLQLMEEGII